MSTRAVDVDPRLRGTPAAIAEARATTPPRLRQMLTGELDAIVMKALAKDPARRYSSVAALAEDVRRYLRHEPVSVRPDSTWYRLRRFAVRRRLELGAAAAVALALIAGTGVAVWQAREARQERDRADRAADAATVQRDLARRQLLRSDAINDLNAFLIADAAPLGSTFTARDLLSRAEGIVSAQKDDAPDVRADVLVSLGRLYWSLGENASAVRVLDQAHTLSRTVADPAVRAQASCALATAVVKAGDTARAGRLIDEGFAAG